VTGWMDSTLLAWFLGVLGGWALHGLFGKREVR